MVAPVGILNQEAVGLPCTALLHEGGFEFIGRCLCGKEDLVNWVTLRPAHAHACAERGGHGK